MNYPPLYRQCIQVILKNEGGYVNDPDDLGGETNRGITDISDGTVDRKADIDGDGTGDVPIKDLTADQATQIYFTRYWRKMNLEGIQDREVVLQIFDHGVNAGIRTAIKIAQRVAGATADGYVGAQTTTLINEYPGNYLDAFKQARRDYYRHITKTRPRNEKFLAGWLNRVENTKLT